MRAAMTAAIRGIAAVIAARIAAVMSTVNWAWRVPCAIGCK